MKETFFLPLLITCIVLGISCSKEKNAATNLFDIEELVLEATENETKLSFNDIEGYIFAQVCDDITPDSVVIYDFKGNEDIINGEWFKVSTDSGNLYIDTKENKLNTSRKFRILYYIRQERYALSVIQKGKE